MSEKKKKSKLVIVLAVVLVLLLIGGAVAAFFILNKDNSSKNNMETKPAVSETQKKEKKLVAKQSLVCVAEISKSEISQTNGVRSYKRQRKRPFLHLSAKTAVLSIFFPESHAYRSLRFRAKLLLLKKS